MSSVCLEERKYKDHTCTCGHPRSKHKLSIPCSSNNYTESLMCSSTLCTCQKFTADPQLLLKEDYEDRAEKDFPRCRARVVQAVNHTPGMTYEQIQNWIKRRKGFYMEVGARVRELRKEDAPRIRTERGRDRKIHVYPT